MRLVVVVDPFDEDLAVFDHFAPTEAYGKLALVKAFLLDSDFGHDETVK